MFGTGSGDAPHPFCSRHSKTGRLYQVLPGGKLPIRNSLASLKRRQIGVISEIKIPGLYLPLPSDRDRRSWLEKHPCTDPFSGRFWLT